MGLVLVGGGVGDLVLAVVREPARGHHGDRAEPCQGEQPDLEGVEAGVDIDLHGGVDLHVGGGGGVENLLEAVVADEVDVVEVDLCNEVFG